MQTQLAKELTLARAEIEKLSKAALEAQTRIAR